MGVYKDVKRGTWFISYRFTDWQGNYRRFSKRGFKTKREALEHERTERLTQSGNLEMTFEDFVDIYLRDIKNRLRENTMQTKKVVIAKNITPYFAKCKMKDISSKNVLFWQNEIMDYRDKKGEKYAQGYLKYLHNQLSAIFNFAVKYYDLKDNPARKAGRMGKEVSEEVEFWTKDEYMKFADEIMDKPNSYYAFEILYWCGLRLGEMLALTPADFDFKAMTVRVCKSYQRIGKRDVITPPKTVKSIRTIHMPDFLTEEMREFIDGQYRIKKTDRVFSTSKSILTNDMAHYSNKLGLKRIRLHGLRHSHVSFLIEKGCTALAIAERVGHETITITYRYAHLFPSKQKEIAELLSFERGKDT